MKPIRSFAIRVGMAFLPCFVSVIPMPLPAAEGTGRKPNIVVILTDDHGWADIGAQGVDKDIRTPNIDRLARDGVRFSRGYVTAPQCVPSRAGLISGSHQNGFGVEDNLKGPLPLEVLTIPERLKQAGYVTGMCGKWHLDLVRNAGGEQQESDRYLPQAHGFDEYWCGAMRRYHASHDLKGNPLAGGATVIDHRFRITVQTEAALAFLDRRAADPGRPWFLYLPWFAPHVPLESPEPWFSRTPAELPRERRQALAMIAAMDDGVGMLREKIRTMGAESDTLVFFIGDNGAPLRKKAWNGSLNLPLTGEKGMLTDGGVRVPFVAAWPGRLPAGKTCGDPVSTLDVGATAVALAGLPRDGALDGVDLMPFLTGKTEAAPHDALYWRWRSQAAVLEYPWKLIHLGKTGRYLFNVTTPDGETRNLISRNPEIAARLENRLKTWSATLKPPGPPERVNAQDNAFFADHVDKSIAGGTHPSKAVKRPNILFILTEDQGAHLGYVGTPGIQTPHMDALAASGAYFRNAFVAYPVCSASKAALMTGRCSHVNGLLNNTQNHHKPASELTPAERKDTIYQRIRVRDGIPTLTGILKAAGYYQGVTHKLHVAPVESFPYDEFIPHPRGQSVTTFIRNAGNAGKPWFLLYNISDSHRKYPDSDKRPIPVDVAKVKPPAFLPDTPVVRKDWAEYLAAVGTADRYVGEAMAALKASGQEENTIVVFMGDHGPSFTRGKMNLTDLGLRVPLVVRAPGMAGGLRPDSLVSELDLVPTLLDLLGLPPLAKTEGISLRPVLEGNEDARIHGHIFAEISHQPLAPGGGMQERSVFDGRFHLIVREGLAMPRQVNEDLKTWEKWGNRTYDETIRVKDAFPEAYRFLTWMDPQSTGVRPPRFELYETAADPDEMKELSSDPAYRKELERLFAVLRKWSEETGDVNMKWKDAP